MMFNMTELYGDCEISYLMKFLNAKNMQPTEIRRLMCDVYGDISMSDGMVRK